MLKNLQKPSFILAGILLLAFLVRLYGFANPLADWHSWRQVDTSSVSRNFTTKGFDLLHPTYHDLSNVPSGKDNPQGYRFVEFPLYNLAQAGLFTIVGIFNLEQWGRLVTILSSLGATVFLYLLVRKYADEVTGLFAAFFYAFLPFSIYYGRVVLPDTSMVMAFLGGIYFFDKWLEDKSKSDKKYVFFILSIMFTVSALLLKPFALFFLLPMLYLAWNAFGLSMLRKWQLWLFAILVIAPLALWRVWIMQFPEGVPANTWLFNGNGIRFRPSFFRWMGYERLVKLISGYIGTIFLILGFYRAFQLKEKWFFFAFIASSFFYVVVVATGNVQHDYYQIPIIPSIAMLLGLGAGYLFHNSYKISGVPLGKVLLILLTAGTLYFGWERVKDYFNINNRQMVAAGEIVDGAIPKDAKVIALYDGDTTFLYQTKRSGWTSYQDPLPVLIEKGADYLVQLNPSEGDRDSLGAQYKVVRSTPEFILIKLH